MPTRRTVIASGASMALLAGCGGRSPRKLAGSAADIPVLRERLESEKMQVAVLEVSLGGFEGQRLAIARTVLRHDREHVDALREAIRELGGSTMEDLVAIRPLRASIDDLVQLKEHTSRAYGHAIPSLANTRLRGTFGALMTVEAEHAMALGLSR